VVLDWGSGCGFKLSWLAQLYGTHNFGLDVAPAPVAWAKKHSSGQHGCTDAATLSWIPDATFDAIISYAALYHLTQDSQCGVVHEMLRVLRPLGRIYIGWFNNPSIGVSVGVLVDPDFWAGECLQKEVKAGRVRVSVHNEAHLFGVEPDPRVVVGDSADAYSLFVWKGA
jgi:SAM-dependent methyltransferase